jgi:hypothetical protein
METPRERLQRGPPMQLNDEEQRTASDGEEGEGDMAATGDKEAPQPTPVAPKPLQSTTPMKRGRPMDNKCAKEEEQQQIQRDSIAKAPRADQRRNGSSESSEGPGSRRPIHPSSFHDAGVGNALR